MAQREGLTLRQLGQRTAFARGHAVVVGTPERIADEMQAWVSNGAADGFNIMPPMLPEGLETFTTQVVPILQERGLFRTDYDDGTLRERYGLPLAEPRSLSAVERPAGAAESDEASAKS
jgi:hypothetical protein